MSGAQSLERFPVHLGLGATAILEPEFDGMEWYEAYAARHMADGSEGRLVALHHFDDDWQSWEMHPLGEEVVVCVSGEMCLIQQNADGQELRIAMKAGEYAINPRGVWHTADIAGVASALFITAGVGTEHRGR